MLPWDDKQLIRMTVTVCETFQALQSVQTFSRHGNTFKGILNSSHYLWKVEDSETLPLLQSISLARDGLSYGPTGMARASP
ncbi:hypothetical protein TNCV_502241 [Trichonephila clavipes]|nr:hypothetical protein TNCV_502241 [Trichonephila clavipes]